VKFILSKRGWRNSFG